MVNNSGCIVTNNEKKIDIYVPSNLRRTILYCLKSQ